MITTHSWVVEVNINTWGTITDDVQAESKDGWWLVPMFWSDTQSRRNRQPYIPKRANGDAEDFEPVFNLEAGLKRLKEIQSFRWEENYRLRNLFDGTVIMGDVI